MIKSSVSRGAGYPRYALLGVIAAGALMMGCNRHASPEFRNLVLVTLDTLRADHLGCYGYPVDTSPFLDSLAREGVLFEQVQSTSSHTGPSHASLFTSLYPYQHGLLTNGAPLAPGLRTLANELRDQGFQTAGFSSVLFLGSVARGFQSFDHPTHSQNDNMISSGALYRSAAETVDQAVAWANGFDQGDRFLLWVHLYDPHNSQDLGGAPRSMADRMAERYRDAWPNLKRYGQEVLSVDLERRRSLRRRHLRYDTQIRFVDRELRRLHKTLTTRGLNRGTLWMITADHGEGLGSRGYLGHGLHIYEEQLHVPLLLHATDAEWSARRISSLVRHVDLLPTILELLGAPTVQRNLEGRSVAGLLRGEPASAETPIAFAQRRPKGQGKLRKNWPEGPVLAARDARYKYIWRNAESNLLFDLVNDPLERKSLIGNGLAAEVELRRYLRRHLGKVAAAEADSGKTPMAEPVRRELEALGYL